MILHCREFDVDGVTVNMGHDRETGKRYYLQEVNETTVFELPSYLTDTVPNLQAIKAIFWIKG